MKGNFRLYICIHFCIKAVDKRTCLCFNVICIHLKDSEGKILPISMLQRAGGWCEPVRRVRGSGSRVGPVNEAPLPVMGHGFPRYRDRACRSPKGPPPGGNQGGTTDQRFVPGARWLRGFSIFLFYSRRERRPRRSGRRRRQVSIPSGLVPDGTPGTAFPTTFYFYRSEKEQPL